MKNIKTFLFISVFLAILIAPSFSSAESIDSLRSKINSLMQKIEELQKQIDQQTETEQETQPAETTEESTESTTGDVSCYDFNTNLKIGSAGDDVKALQKILNEEGYSVSETGVFDSVTADALSDFQEEYKDEILTPNNLNNGNGFAGTFTRKKLNSLFGCVYPSKTFHLSIKPKKIMLFSNYTFKGKIRNAPKNADVLFYLQRPDGTMKENGTNAGKTDKQGRFAKTIKRKVSSGKTGTYKAWVVVGNMESNIVDIEVSGDNPKPSPEPTSTTIPTPRPSPTPSPSPTPTPPPIIPHITVLSPNGGEVWQAGSTQTIRWSSVNVQNVLIYTCYTSTTLGALCSQLSGIPSTGVNASSGYYNWYIDPNAPYVPGSSLKIRIVDVTSSSGVVRDESDASFSIVAATTTNCVDSDGGKSYYTKGYCTWSKDISQHTDSCIYDTATKTYTLYETYCDNAGYIQTESYKCPNGCNDGACITTSTSTSTITVLSPNGGERWTIGLGPYTVKWTTNNIPATNLMSIGLRNTITGIDYSLIGDTSNDGIEGVVVSSAVPAGNYKLFVKTLVNNVSTIDWSDARFSIVAATIATTKPYGIVQVIHFKTRVDNPTINTDNPYLLATELIYSWSELEPQEGKFRWDVIDSTIKLFSDKGKRVILSFRTVQKEEASTTEERGATPQWVYNAGAKNIYVGEIYRPIYWDPVFLNKYEKFINAVALHYDGNPAVEYVIMGVGEFGTTKIAGNSTLLAEYQKNGYNTTVWSNTIKNIVDIYKKYFQKTPIALTISTFQQLGDGSEIYIKPVAEYAAQNGVYIFNHNLSGNPEFASNPFLLWYDEFYRKYKTTIILGVDNSVSGEREKFGSIDNLVKNAFGGVNGIPLTHTTYLRFYHRDISAATPGNPDYDPAFEIAIKDAYKRLKDNASEGLGSLEVSPTVVSQPSYLNQMANTLESAKALLNQLLQVLKNL